MSDRTVMWLAAIMGAIALMLVVFDTTHETCSTDTECEELHGVPVGEQ